MTWIVIVKVKPHYKYITKYRKVSEAKQGRAWLVLGWETKYRKEYIVPVRITSSSKDTCNLTYFLIFSIINFTVKNIYTTLPKFELLNYIKTSLNKMIIVY